MPKRSPINITVDLSSNRAHIFNININLCHASQGQKFTLPSWTPGSYLMREFAQHLIAIKAYEEGHEITVCKLNKNTFALNNTSANVTLNYQIYGFDSSIRAAFIDDTQAFFNGSALFLCPLGMEEEEFLLSIPRAAGQDFLAWQVATAMPALDIDTQGFGTYTALSYLELVDYPFQISDMKRLSFKAANTPHEIVLVGDVRSFDEKRLVSDIARICESQIKIFGGHAPFEKYLFIARFEEGGSGGLEHRNSTMLLSSPYALPRYDLGEPDNAYRTFLSLCSHEYFHAWNVKRLLPKSFVPYDLNRECYTTMLWLFEGITSYYDDLVLRKAELISAESYLEVLAKNYGRLLKNKGRLVQSVAQASFDAWIKFYRPNENSSNVAVSYYLKGSFIGLIIDLMIRARSQGQKSLDEVMKFAFNLYGHGCGISEEEFFALLAEVGGIETQELRELYIYGTSELPVVAWLAEFGVDATIAADEQIFDDKTKLPAYWGMKCRFDEHQRAIITYVDKDGPAMRAGLSPFDEVMAVNNIRLDPVNLADLLGAIKAHKAVNVTVARKKVVKNYQLTPEPLPLSSCKLALKRQPSAAERSSRSSWLGA